MGYRLYSASVATCMPSHKNSGVWSWFRIHYITLFLFEFSITYVFQWAISNAFVDFFIAANRLLTPCRQPGGFAN